MSRRPIEDHAARWWDIMNRHSLMPCVELITTRICEKEELLHQCRLFPSGLDDLIKEVEKRLRYMRTVRNLCRLQRREYTADEVSASLSVGKQLSTD